MDDYVCGWMAELAYALDLGSSGITPVGVQVPLYPLKAEHILKAKIAPEIIRIIEPFLLNFNTER
jgi:hypothetical protein